MKKYLFLGILCLSVANVAFAQQGKRKLQGNNKSRMESYQIAFITERLNLTTEEAQKFWPIFNEYREQSKKIRQEERPEKSIDDMSDSEAEQFIKNHLDRESRELEIHKAYIQKLRGVIPPKKIAKLQNLDKEFKKELLDRARERRQGNND